MVSKSLKGCLLWPCCAVTRQVCSFSTLLYQLMMDLYSFRKSGDNEKSFSTSSNDSDHALIIVLHRWISTSMALPEVLSLKRCMFFTTSVGAYRGRWKSLNSSSYNAFLQRSAVEGFSSISGIPFARLGPNSRLIKFV
jgi:hypothetical protein